MLFLSSCTKSKLDDYDLVVYKPTIYYCPKASDVEYQNNGFFQAKTYYNNAYMRWSADTPKNISSYEVSSFIGANMICPQDQLCQLDCTYSFVGNESMLNLWAVDEYQERFLKLSKGKGIWKQNQCRSNNIKDCTFYINP